MLLNIAVGYEPIFLYEI